MSTKEKENFKNALAYIPFFCFFLFFTEKKLDARYKKNIQYSMILCVAWIVLSAIVMWQLKGLVTLAYLGIAGFLAYKAYNGEDQKIEQFDNFLDK